MSPMILRAVYSIVEDAKRAMAGQSKKEAFENAHRLSAKVSDEVVSKIVKALRR